MPLQTTRIYAYGVARNRLSQAARRLNVPVVLANDVGAADVLVTLRSYYRKRQRSIVDAENRGMPIYVLRANTINQMQQFLGDLFNLSAEVPDENAEDNVRQETLAAINAVLEWRALGRAAAGGLVCAPPAAPDGAPGQPALAFLRQRAAPPRAHLP